MNSHRRLSRLRSKRIYQLSTRSLALPSVVLVAGAVVLPNILLQNIADELRPSAPKYADIRKQEVLVPHAQRLRHLLDQSCQRSGAEAPTGDFHLIHVNLRPSPWILMDTTFLDRQVVTE
jgi:hypothetical protein